LEGCQSLQVSWLLLIEYQKDAKPYSSTWCTASEGALCCPKHFSVAHGSWYSKLLHRHLNQFEGVTWSRKDNRFTCSPHHYSTLVTIRVIHNSSLKLQFGHSKLRQRDGASQILSRYILARNVGSTSNKSRCQYSFSATTLVNMSVPAHAA